jgi:hypothetical protein
METQEKILLLVAVLLIALALYLTLSAPVVKPVASIPNATSASGAEELLLKGLSLGNGQLEYAYAYYVVSDGYNTSYVLTKNGNDSLVVVQDPLSTKEVYFLNNDTILCMTYEGAESCASVQNETFMANYLESLRVLFFNGVVIQTNQDNLVYLINNSYAQLNPVTSTSSVNGHPCTEITYVLNYTNISVADAARFYVSANTPKVFNWSMCVDNSTGYPWEKSFNYTYDGMLQTYAVYLVSYNTTSSKISIPTNLSGDVITPLLAEMDQQVQMADCYTTKQGDALDQCLAAFALTNREPEICDSAGDLRDRCLFTLVQVTSNESICPAILSQPYKDDCYIELAGYYANNSWCSYLQNASNLAQCMNVSVPTVVHHAPQSNVSAANSSARENGSIEVGNQNMTINEFLNYMDQNDDADSTPSANDTNETAPANRS